MDKKGSVVPLHYLFLLFYFSCIVESSDHQSDQVNARQMCGLTYFTLFSLHMCGPTLFPLYMCGLTLSSLHMCSLTLFSLHMCGLTLFCLHIRRAPL